MRYTTLVGTELETSRLGFGTASLHHALRGKDKEALLRAALDNGITHFDTARMYGEGSAERALGKYLGTARQRVTLATKFGIPAIPVLERAPWLVYPQRLLGKVGRRVMPALWRERRRCLSRSCVEASLQQSLKALRTDWIDIFFVHEPGSGGVDDLLELAEYLHRQRTAGVIRYLGLAGSAADCVAVVQQTEGLFDVLQVEDSIQQREADVVTGAGLPLQITYGYVRRAAETQPHPDALTLISQALERNAQGMVLISTRRPKRVRELARLAA